MSATALSFSDPHPFAGACAASRQDGLDLLAVVAGLKPVCLVGRGSSNEAWSDMLRAVAHDAALAVVDAAPWGPEGDLPNWYREATDRRRARNHVLYLCRDHATARRVAALSAQGRVSVDSEASLLGYPRCCVAQHHVNTLAYERLLAERTERFSRGDRSRMARMIETGAEPTPTTQAEWEQIEALTRTAPAPYTSVNMCDPCARDRASPAMRLSRAYADLAARAGYPAR